jgi:hypothetical protein
MNHAANLRLFAGEIARDMSSKLSSRLLQGLLKLVFTRENDTPVGGRLLVRLLG